MLKVLKKLLILLVIFVSCEEDLDPNACKSCSGRGYTTNCAECDNTGNCSYCKRGFILCPYCNNGTFYNYNEMKYERCKMCGGDGVLKVCPSCRGNYIDKCWKCRGIKVTCLYCKGTGKIL